MEKLVTNSSPKPGHFGPSLEGVKTGKARQAKGFSVLTSFLTRKKSGLVNWNDPASNPRDSIELCTSAHAQRS